MKLIIALFFTALLSVSAQPKFGLVFYSGPSSADIFIGRLTDPNYTKIEFYRGAKKLGEVVSGGPSPGVVTDRGISQGLSYTYEYRAYRTSGGFLQGPCGGFSSIIGGDVRGFLVRPDTIAIGTALIDSLYILGGGAVTFQAGQDPVNVPGGNLYFAPASSLGYNPQALGKILGIRVFDGTAPGDPPGKITGGGGQLVDVNVECEGQFGPLENFTMKASDVNLYNSYPSVLKNCTFDYYTAQSRNDPVYINSPNVNIKMTGCTVKNSSQIFGIDTAMQNIIDLNGQIKSAVTINNEFRNGGELMMRPVDVPTICRNNHFTTGGSMSVANQSVVEFNLFEDLSLITVAPAAAGFDPSDVAGIHINFNEFAGGTAKQLSVVGADTIDATRNFWNLCTGPTDRGGLRARLDPFLRVRYPGTSYWFDIAPNKTTVLADGEDSIIFTGHFYNVITGQDSAGAKINYLIRSLDTLDQGVLTMDNSGNCTLVFRVPQKYKDAGTVQVYFNGIQCIDKAFIIVIKETTGPDLEVIDGRVIQVQGAASAVIAEKPFTVFAQISSTEPVPAKFGVRVMVNNVAYDTFYVNIRDNIGLLSKLMNPTADMNLPNAQILTLIFPIDASDIPAGKHTVSITIDPPSATNPKGLILEGDETNNTFSFDVDFKTTSFGDGKPDFSVFVQPFDGYPGNRLDYLAQVTDSARNFIEMTWPMKRGQVSFTNAASVADYLPIFPDTLLQETWEYYLMKAYKQLRMAQPAYDRYILAASPDWAAWRFDRVYFQHRATTTLVWSGISDLAVISSGSHSYFAHGLGHTFGLRRHDIDPVDENWQEEYYNNFVGKPVDEGMDTEGRRLLFNLLQNKFGQRGEVYCFMGNSRLSNPFKQFTTWVCDVDYTRLMQSTQNFTGTPGTFSKIAAKALLIEGSIDSTSKEFSFGPWARLENATPSNMVDSALATYTVKLLDNSGATVSRYFYRPTFVALGLDEIADYPQMEKEYFAFVVPSSDAVTRVVVEQNGNVVKERVLNSGAPVVRFSHPTDGLKLVRADSILATWEVTSDPDGDTEFWYTVYQSKDNGVTWTMLQFESKSTQLYINAVQGGANRLRVIASDGLNTSEQTIAFSVESTSADQIASPGTATLFQNYPNPFSASTILRYSLPSAVHVTLSIYDALGRHVETLADGYHGAGMHAVQFNSASRTNGVYFAILRAGSMQSTIRMTFAR